MFMPSSPQPNVQTNAEDVPFGPGFWLLVILTGIGAGLGGGLLMKLLHAVQHVSWSYHSGSFLEGVERNPPSRHLIVLACAGLVAGVGRLLLRITTGGHGGEISETIWFKSGRFPPLQTLAKAVLSIVLVGMGSSLGREGALKQAGAVVASRLATWARLSAPQVRLLTAYGAGAGIAAAYNMPCGGAFFALEVLLGGLTLRLVPPALAASGIATAVSWLLLPDKPTYAVPHYAVTVPHIVWALFAGPLLGLAAALYVRVIGWADERKPHGWRLVLVPLLVFTALGAVSVWYPQLLGNGKDVVQQAFTDRLGLDLLLTLPALKLLASASCLGSGAPGGLFTPTITFGAVLGGLLGYGWTRIFIGTPLGGYAIIGAGAVLAAATQGPVSSVIMILELTWRIDPLMVPLLIAVAGAMLVARRLERRSIYSARVRRGETAAVLRPGAVPLGAASLISAAAEVASAALRFPEVARRLLALPDGRSSLYVVDDRGRLVGELTTERIGEVARRSVPLETTTASDLAEPVPTVPACARMDDAVQQLKRTNRTELPVVDPTTERLIGTLTRPGASQPGRSA